MPSKTHLHLTQHRAWDLDDLVGMIFNCIRGLEDALRLASTCKRFRQLSKQRLLVHVDIPYHAEICE